jgi:hypothetical protein
MSRDIIYTLELLSITLYTKPRFITSNIIRTFYWIICLDAISVVL